jgi:tripeptide aminopeptidase
LIIFEKIQIPMLDKQHILERFLSYVKIDTESDPSSDTTPSTDKQWELANKLAKELEAIGLSEVRIDDNAYVMGYLTFKCQTRSASHWIYFSF